MKKMKYIIEKYFVKYKIKLEKNIYYNYYIYIEAKEKSNQMEMSTSTFE